MLFPTTGSKTKAGSHKQKYFFLFENRKSINQFLTFSIASPADMNHMTDIQDTYPLDMSGFL